MHASADPGYDAAVRIVAELQRHGHIAYLAGGCVRDRLLGRVPKDYDVATDAPPERVRALFPRSQFVGEAFGVVLVRLPKRPAIEVATFRQDWAYVDGRRPEGVTFTDARHDAERRDFTINGLFEDPMASESDPDRIVDYVRGRADLERGVIRAIGDADHRFAEDYLRMLRAVRFAAALGFSVEERTASAVRAHARYLGQISRERIGQEVLRMLGPEAMAGARCRAASLMQQLHLDGPVLNEDRADPALPTLGALGAEASYPAALGAWALDRHVIAGGSALEAGGLMPAVARWIVEHGASRVSWWRRALCLSNEQRDELAGALATLGRLAEWASLPAAGRKRLLADPWWAPAWAMMAALGHEAGCAALARRVEMEAAPLRAGGIAPEAFLTGEDLIAAGRAPGPAFRRLLDAAYDAQLEGRLRTRQEALEWIRVQP